jgi:predicted amidohydrolase
MVFQISAEEISGVGRYFTFESGLKGKDITRNKLGNFMSMNAKIVSFQMNCRMGDVRANLETIRSLAKSVERNHPDFVCFPELATTGYSLNEKWRKYADEIPGETSDELSSIAKELGAYLICGTDELDAETGKIYDSSILLSSNGRLLGVYRKVHLWDQERKYFARGSGFPVFETKFGKIGIGICYDIEFPEAARALATRGAQILFFPSAQMSPIEKVVDTYALSRAVENTCFLVFSNRIGTEGRTHFFGHSQIASPECRVLGRAKSKPYAVAEVDLSILPKIRRKMPYLSQLVPEAYSGQSKRVIRAEKPQLR